MATTPRPVEVIERYGLDGIYATVVGRYRTSRIHPQDGSYVRVTQGQSIHGRRYCFHATYDSAVESAIAWGSRRGSN